MASPKANGESVTHQNSHVVGTDYAGQGGFDVNVKGNTDLKGGIVASTAESDKNRLTTGTLTSSDIENKAEYSSSTSTIVGSYSGGKSVAASDPNLGPVQPSHVEWAGNTNLLQGAANSLAATAAGNAQRSIAGNAAGITKSAIAAGTVVVTDDTGQQTKTGKSADETVAELNRDTANANQSIDKIFDAQKVKDQQELNRLKSEVAQQAAPLIYDAVGTLTQNLPVEGKVAAHAIIGGLIAEAMGGKFVAGAAGDAAATAAAELVGQQILTNPDLQGMSEPDRKALVQLAGTIIAAGAGKAIGGSGQDAGAAGAVGGLGTQYNWAMHPPVLGPQVPPTPADAQKPNSPPGKPAYDGDESLLTGTPDQSKQHTWGPMFQPIADAVARIKDAGKTITTVVGTILPNPMELFGGLGAIASTDTGRYEVLTNPQARDFAKSNGWTTSAPDKVKDAARGSPVFHNPDDGNYYSPDKAGHRADNAWKAFDNKGNRVGTFVWNGTQMIKISK
ncbi:hypothetical protein [Cupriavidus gilardii]|uniref:hypothetical protein n=1 Tax=Cupriavidus gilardii TaxID=82541 RepID=UPI0012E91485|nr:hypothetical protein [Cupriavidus gilardii]